MNISGKIIHTPFNLVVCYRAPVSTLNEQQKRQLMFPSCCFVLLHKITLGLGDIIINETSNRLKEFDKEGQFLQKPLLNQGKI